MKAEILKKWSIGILAGCLAGGGYAQTIPNGSFENGTVGIGSIPNGWSSRTGTVDIKDESNFDASVSASVSPDGGQYVGAISYPGVTEGIETTISGLTIGEAYTISYYQANFGRNFGGYGGDSRWLFYLDDSLAHTSSSISVLANTWYEESFTFTATDATVELGFEGDYPAGETLRSYSLIDGLSITQAGVPEPSSTALLGLSALGFLARRKR